MRRPAGSTATGPGTGAGTVDAHHGGRYPRSRWGTVARRPGGQSQFSAQLRAKPATTTSIAELQRWVADHLDENLTVEVLAAQASMSPRTFARLFVRETGMTPTAYVEELRVEAAQHLLETSDLTVEAVAGRVGMKHPEILHRAFRRRVGTTPDRYRQYFTRRAS